MSCINDVERKVNQSLGDICDRWFEIKKKTGFGEMSDPKFIHYLLRLEEERQAKIGQIAEIQSKEGNFGDTNGKI